MEGYDRRSPFPPFTDPPRGASAPGRHKHKRMRGGKNSSPVCSCHAPWVGFGCFPLNEANRHLNRKGPEYEGSP